MTNKLLLALQFFDGDRAQALRLARFIADLEPRHCDIADFLFVARFDSTHDKGTVAHVSKKFDVRTFVAKNQGTGWPHGPNTEWFDTMNWVYSMTKAKKVKYKAVLTFEADCCPLSANWIAELSEAWDRAGDACVVGAMQDNPVKHINGNCMFTTRLPFLKWLARSAGDCPYKAGWDIFFAREFERRGWAHTNRQRSFWGCKTMDEITLKALMNSGVSFLHGVKDNSALSFARGILLPQR